jgi:putative membrane protein
VDSEKVTRKFYSKMIRLPSNEVLVGVNGVEWALVLARGIEIGIDFALSFFAYLFALLLVFRLKWRTVVALSTIFSFIYLVFSLFPAYFLYSFGTFLPLVDYPLLIDYKETKAILLSTSATFFPLLVTLTKDWIFYAYVIAVALLTSFYIYSINRKGLKVIGISSMNVVRPFIRAINYKREAEVENFLEKISIPYYAHVYVLKVDGQKLVVPEVHYGLYGTVGSSYFPYDLEEKVNDSTAFHGPGSHDIDVPSRKYSLEVISKVSKALEDMEENEFYGIRFNDIGSFRLTTLSFDKSSLTFVERPGKGIDDLPTSLWKDMIANNNFLVDCHNESLVEDFSKEEISQLKSFVRRRREGRRRPLLFAYSEGSLDKECEGLCSRKVKVFVFSDEEKKVAIVYVYGNNASRELKEQVYGKLAGLVDRAILVTPDDHSCTGTSLGNLYTPSQPCPSLVDLSYKLTLDALSKMREVDSSQKVTKVKTKVIGKIISAMVEGLEKVGNYTLRTFWIPIASSYVLLFLFSSLYALLKL